MIKINPKKELDLLIYLSLFGGCPARVLGLGDKHWVSEKHKCDDCKSDEKGNGYAGFIGKGFARRCWIEWMER